MTDLFKSTTSNSAKATLIAEMSVKDLVMLSVAEATSKTDLRALRTLVRILQEELLDSVVALTKHLPVSTDDKLMVGHAYHKNLPCHREFD